MNRYKSESVTNQDSRTQGHSLTTPGHRLCIAIGVHEIANMISTVAAALRDAGHDVTSVVREGSAQHYYSTNVYDRSVRERSRANRLDAVRYRFQMIWELLRLLPRHNVFFFIWKVSFLPVQLDFLLLRLLRKKVIVLYCGDDIRYRPHQIRLDRVFTESAPHPLAGSEEEVRYCEVNNRFWPAFWSTKIAEKSGATIWAGRDGTTFQGRDYVCPRIPQKQLLDRPRQPSEPPLLLHAPTDPVSKGTKEVEAAIDLLKAEGAEFRFELIQGQPNEYVLDRLQHADIVIDQPALWIGRFGVEALACSCVVIGGNHGDYMGWGAQSPVLQFERDPRLLADTIRPLIHDRGHRAELMAASWQFWRRFHSYPAFSQFFDEAVNGRSLQLQCIPRQRDLIESWTVNRWQRAALKLFW